MSHVAEFFLKLKTYKVKDSANAMSSNYTVHIFVADLPQELNPLKNKPVVNEVLLETILLKRCAKEIRNLKHRPDLELERKTDKTQEVEQVSK